MSVGLYSYAYPAYSPAITKPGFQGFGGFGQVLGVIETFGPAWRKRLTDLRAKIYAYETSVKSFVANREQQGLMLDHLADALREINAAFNFLNGLPTVGYQWTMELESTMNGYATRAEKHYQLAKGVPAPTLDTGPSMDLEPVGPVGAPGVPGAPPEGALPPTVMQAGLFGGRMGMAMLGLGVLAIGWALLRQR